MRIRIGRRDALRRRRPVELMSFLGQAALYWMIGGQTGMIEQLR
ncbi:MAG TPA: Scr1 family TA system antitoxin-like transcriptional regulator [Pseudonocardiaceae bacterium]|nr:Scr1 family TA system antitoxin-like transcriptional regulator [Pseudonocardiaceae bacterium]